MTPAAPPRPLLKPALIALAALPLLAAAWIADRVAGSITGPLAVAVNDDGSRVAVAAPGRIYYLDGNGALSGVDEGILHPEATDAGLFWLDGDLLVSPDVDNDLLRCNDESCALFSEDTYAPRGPVQVFREGNRLWFSEVEIERIQRYFVDGRRIDMPISDLVAPGSLYLDGDVLYVANTGKKQLQTHRMHKRGIDEAEEFAKYHDGAEEHPIDRPSRFARAGNGWRALFTDKRRRHAILAAVDANGGVEPVAVDGLVNPVALATLGNDLLVVDEDTMQVLRVDAQGKATPFGDDDFRAQLAEDAGLRAALRWTTPVCAILAALLAALGGTLMVRQLAQQRGDPPVDVRAGADGIVWLPRECDRLGEHLPWALAAVAPAAIVPALCAAGFGYAVAGAVWAVAVFAAGAVPPMRAAAQARPANDLKLGLQERRLVVADTDKGLREFPLAMVGWDEYRLQPAAGLDIPLMRDGVWLFHQPTLETVLMPKLNPGKKLAS